MNLNARIGLATLCLFGSALCAQQAKPSDSPAQMIDTRERSLIQAENNNDLESMVKFCADPFTYVDEDEKVFSSVSVLLLRTATIKVEEVRLSDLRSVKLTEDTVLVTYRLTERGQSRNTDAPFEWSSKRTTVWIRKGSDWKVRYIEDSKDK